jgi:HIRAN domain
MFTKGAARLGSIPTDLFNLDINRLYRSNELIALFRNRLPSRNRADFLKIAEWLNLRGDESEFELLAKFGLIPGTDSILVYPEPDIVSGTYSLEFFLHGIRHMHADAAATCDALESGQRLLPILDVQNPVDPNAVALRTEKDSLMLGYVPAFYADDFRRLLSQPKIASAARVNVVRNNRNAPIQLRILCKFQSPVPAGFQALDSDAHKPFLLEAAE